MSRALVRSARHRGSAPRSGRSLREGASVGRLAALVLGGLLAASPLPAQEGGGASERSAPLDSVTRGPVTLPTGGFELAYEVTLPRSRAEIYDALTGDISDWWDHSFSEDPYRLALEPEPGGRFLEVFDESGDGAVHARVILARRPEIIRFVGPLGLSGYALELVCTYELEPVGSDSTRLAVTVRGAGQLEDGWPAAVDGAWRHFIFERFVPHVREGAGAATGGGSAAPPG